MGKGGYRYGAGRPASRPRAESYRALDIRRMAKAGCIKPHRGFSWQWSNQDGEKVASVDCKVSSEGNALTVAYNWKRPYETGWQASEKRITLNVTPCHYGGQRLWFLCPFCNRRAALLHIMGASLRCPRCARISYASQRGDALDRAWLKQQKAEARLIDGWQRPKRMRRTTWARLTEIITHCERIRDQSIDDALARWGNLL